MKLITIVFLVLIFTAATSFAAEKGIGETGEAFVKAFKANDLEGIVSLYAPDAVLFPPDAVEAVGKDAIRASYAGMLNAFTVQDITIIDAHHETHADLSFSWGRYSVSMAPKAGGDPVQMEGRFTDVSKRINGKWLYVTDHASVPFTPPTQTAPAQK